MKTMRVVGAAIAFVLAITFSLRGQATVTAIPAGTVSLSAANIRMLGTLSDAQLGEFLNVLAATPTIAAEDLPRGGPTHDAAVLEFDMVSTNSFTLQFQYIFASEEYPEYVGTRYDDPMAIFVSTNRAGTNWINSITNDIALVPGTTNVPVSVNTINGGYLKGNISPTNPQFYVDNHDPNPNFSAVPPYAVDAPVFNIQYDGMTVLLTAQTQISPGIPCHVKIAIADAGDPGRDSAVFIKAWSPCQCQ